MTLLPLVAMFDLRENDVCIEVYIFRKPYLITISLLYLSIRPFPHTPPSN